MHYVAGALLCVQFVLLWILEPSVELPGLTIAAWGVWGVGAALLVASMMTLRRRGRVPEGESFVATNALVLAGVYGLVRHPLYLGWILMHVALVLFEPNWIQAAVGLAGSGSVYASALQEERALVQRFGQAYRRYMRAVPRFNLVIGAVRAARRSAD
jgi:protein-S-isoprenylcysteine O-methyltransferase Ste14